MSLLARILSRLAFEVDIARGLQHENQQAKARLTFITSTVDHRLGELAHKDDIASVDEWGHSG